jgi:hypothetical protein
MLMSGASGETTRMSFGKYERGTIIIAPRP